jgi:LmbE family N-acetylglucosaminyl deacetylase
MNYRRVLVFGAHPDDEIAMAGTIAKMAMKKVKVVVLTFTDGCEGYPKPEMKKTIVAVRRKESNASDRVLGVHNHIYLEIPDMGLVNNKETILRCVHAIRKVRPDAVFAHGPDEHHRDHIAAHAITIEACWQAGEPVAAELGPPWKTSHLYFYSGVQGMRPRVVYDVSETEHKRLLAMSKHVSQHILLARSKEDLEEQAKWIKRSKGKFVEHFYLADGFVLEGFPPR